MVPTLKGTRVPLSEVAGISTTTGPAFIYRDANRRFIGVKFTVRDRDFQFAGRDWQPPPSGPTVGSGTRR